MARLDNLNVERKARQNRYFSESLKRKLIKDYELNLITIAEISRSYQVTRSAVYKWIYKYSVNLKRETKQVIELKSDVKKIALLEARIKELEAALGRKQFEVEFKDKMIEIASEDLGVDIKKKVGSQLSSGTGQTGKSTKGK